MSKRKRAQRATGRPAPASRPDVTRRDPGTETRAAAVARTAVPAPAGTARPERRTVRPETRSRQRASQPSTWSRYRTLILGGAAAIGIAIALIAFLGSAGAGAHACAALLTPPPGASPAADGELGFPTEDRGNAHVSGGITYELCPPTSGPHYDQTQGGPLRRGFYEPDTVPPAGTWVHSLEHGYVVIAYRGGESPPSAEELEAMRTVFRTAPASDFPGSCPSVPNKVIVLRFDDMSTRFGLLAWDRALLTDEFDPQQALDFYEQWVDPSHAPEAGLC